MKDRKDVDVNQKGVSPQVPEVQGAPDGRGAGAKKDGDMSPGVKAAKGLDAEEEEKAKKDAEEEKAKKDADEKEKKEKEDAEEMDAEEFKKQLDAMTAKCDALEEKIKEKGDGDISPKVSGKPSGAPQFDRKDSKDFQLAVRARSRLERAAEALVSAEVVEKFDSMSDDEIRRAAIQARYPKNDLKGKSSTYLEVRFDSLAEEVETATEGRREMGRGMLERYDAADKADPKSARDKARNDAKDEWKQPLSAVKK